MPFTPFTATELIDEDAINLRLNELADTLADIPVYPVGIILPFADDVLPDGYLLCDGTAVSRTTYADLFAVCGTTYGVGNGSTTFNLPDMRGRIPVGAGTGSGLTARTLGQTFGAETVTLAEGDLAVHTHTINGQAIQVTSGAGGAANGTNTGTGSSGSGGSHTNLGASLSLNFMIKAGA